MSRYTDDVVQQKNVSINYQYETEKFVSLEKALAPISADTNNLTQHIQIAKTRCCYPSKHGLTRDEAAAIYLYTMEWGEYSLYPIDKLPSVKKCVWRGMSGDISKNYVRDEILVWPTVNSCSASTDIVKHFLASKSGSILNLFQTNHSTLFMIEIENGKDVRGYTRYPSEDEVILPPGTKLHVISNALHHNGGLHIIHLQEIYTPPKLVKDRQTEPISNFKVGVCLLGMAFCILSLVSYIIACVIRFNFTLFT